MEDENNIMIEQLFSSRGRVRVIKTIFRLGEANISKIARITGLHHKLVEKYLLQLKDYGIVEEHRYGRLRLFKLNYTNPKTYLIRELLEALEET